MILSGMAYNTETEDWDAWRDVDILGVELAGNFKVLFNAWNKGTNYWLKEPFYKRLGKTGKKPGFNVEMATFAIFAFWHGFNPVYFLTFLLAGLFRSLGQQFRHTLRPLFLPPEYETLASEERQKYSETPGKRLYDLLSIVCVHMALNFTAIPFMLMRFNLTMEAWATLSYYGLAMCFVPYAFLLLGGAHILKGLQRKCLGTSVTVLPLPLMHTARLDATIASLPKSSAILEVERR